MDHALSRTIAEVEQQERELVLPSFTHDDAWRLGTFLVGLAIERRLVVVVDVRHGDQVAFHAARPGTSADNDSWIERKVRVVRRFGRSSYLAGLQAESHGTTFEPRRGSPCRSTPGTAAPSPSGWPAWVRSAWSPSPVWRAARTTRWPSRGYGRCWRAPPDARHRKLFTRPSPGVRNIP